MSIYPSKMAVFKNGVHVANLWPATKAHAKRFIKKEITSTHMGEWRKLSDNFHAEGWEYSTTIGVSYQFKKLSKHRVVKP